MARALLIVAVLMALASVAHADSFSFSTGVPDGKMGAASRLPAGSAIDIETADDFILLSQTTITSASFYGLLPSTVQVSDVSEVAVEVYRVFPLDSLNPASGHVPTRVNSPSDVTFDSRDSTANSLSFTAMLISTSFGTVNSVVNGINPLPNQTTGGEGAASGNEVLITTTITPPLVLPSGHYFFVPQVLLTNGNFLWLSAPKPIVTPGTPFTPDLQGWIRNASLNPDWLRIGTDIVGSGSFNHAFTLTGTDDIIFRNGFD